MAAIYPPSLEQIKEMRSKAYDAKAFKIIMDRENYVLDSRTSFLIWDDTNKILTSLSPNMMLATQSSHPFRIRQFGYDFIESFEYEYVN